MKTITKLYRKLSRYVFRLALLISLMLSAGCAAVNVTAYVPPTIVNGEVMLLHPGSTYNGIMQAVRGSVGTARFAKDGYYLFTWVVPNQGAAFAVIQDGKMGVQNFLWQWGGKGAIINSKDWSEMQRYLIDAGWRSLPAASIPAAFIAELVAAAGALVVISAGLPSVLILPAGMFDAPAMLAPGKSVLQ